MEDQRAHGIFRCLQKKWQAMDAAAAHVRGASAHLGHVPGLGGAAYVDSGELPGTRTWLKGQESTENFRLKEESPEK
jgi:hypothetical protein